MKGYVYVIKDPDTKHVVYVGSTIKNIHERMVDHINYSKVSNQPIHIYLRNLTTSPIIEIFLEVEYVRISDLRNKEKEVISFFGKKGIPLYNRQNESSRLEVSGTLINTKIASIKTNKAVLDKVRKHVKKTKQNIGGFYDLAALDKIKSDKMTEKIIKSNSQSGKNKM